MGDGEAEFEVLAPWGLGVSSAEEKGSSRETIGLGWDGENGGGEATHCCPQHAVMDGHGRGNRQAIGQENRDGTDFGGLVPDTLLNFTVNVNR